MQDETTEIECHNTNYLTLCSVEYKKSVVINFITLIVLQKTLVCQHMNDGKFKRVMDWFVI